MLKVYALLVFYFFIISCGSAKKREKPQTKPAEVKAEEAMVKKADEVPHWGYQGIIGPDLWGSLSDKFKLCKDGKNQSPINLKWKKPTDNGNMSVNYKLSPVVVSNSGQAVEAIFFTADGQLKIRGKNYQLIKMTIHTPSEHQLSGKSFPGEIQFLHKNNDGQLAIVSSFIKIGNESAPLQALLKSLPPTKKTSQKMEEPFSPSGLLPTTLTYYHYMGSLTYPPCSENINWNVLNTPIEASQAQLDQLSLLYKGNNRPLQPVGQRSVINFK